MTDLRERVARALQTHCDVDPGIDGLIASVETLCREFAAEQLRDVARWIETPDEAPDCVRCGATVDHLRKMADAIEKVK